MWFISSIIDSELTESKITYSYKPERMELMLVVSPKPLARDALLFFFESELVADNLKINIRLKAYNC